MTRGRESWPPSARRLRLESKGLYQVDSDLLEDRDSNSEYSERVQAVLDPIADVDGHITQNAWPAGQVDETRFQSEHT